MSGRVNEINEETITVLLLTNEPHVLVLYFVIKRDCSRRDKEGSHIMEWIYDIVISIIIITIIQKMTL